MNDFVYLSFQIVYQKNPAIQLPGKSFHLIIIKLRGENPFLMFLYSAKWFLGCTSLGVQIAY